MRCVPSRKNAEEHITKGAFAAGRPKNRPKRSPHDLQSETKYDDVDVHGLANTNSTTEDAEFLRDFSLVDLDLAELTTGAQNNEAIVLK